MATIRREGLPEFWVTGLAKLLVGDQVCQYEAWAKAHFRFDRKEPTGRFAQWKADHTEQLGALVRKLEADGWEITLERYVRLTGETAVITGKPDVIKRKEDCRPTIVDVKSGTPRESDIVQVCLYMGILPLAWKAPNLTFAGEVVYPTHTISITPEEARPFKARAFQLVKELATSQPPTSPSKHSCRFCEVPDCPDRWVEEVESATTAEF